MPNLYFGSSKVCPVVVKADQAIPTYQISNGTISRKTYALTGDEFKGVTNVGNHGLYYKFYYCNNITGPVVFPDLTTISEDNSFHFAFYYCSGITSASFPSLTTISAYYGFCASFNGCSSLTSVNFSALKSITGYYACGSMFNAAYNLSSVTFPVLDTLTGNQALNYAFSWYNNGGTSKTVTISFPALKSTSFGSYTNQFDNMLTGTTGGTVHFPSNLQSVIGSWTSVQNGFGGTNTTILWDLPATT